MMERPFGSIEEHFGEITDPRQGQNVQYKLLDIIVIAICGVITERITDHHISRETRFYISSLVGNAEQILHAVRGHWGVENGLHWVLDVAFDEDQSRVRKDHAPANLAVLRQMALNLLKQEKTASGGIKAKRLQAGWNENYLLKVLSG